MFRSFIRKNQLPVPSHVRDEYQGKMCYFGCEIWTLEESSRILIQRGQRYIDVSSMPNRDKISHEAELEQGCLQF